MRAFFAFIAYVRDRFGPFPCAYVETLVRTAPARRLDFPPNPKTVKQPPNQILEAMRFEVFEVERVQGLGWLSFFGHLKLFVFSTRVMKGGVLIRSPPTVASF